MHLQVAYFCLLIFSGRQQVYPKKNQTNEKTTRQQNKTKQQNEMHSFAF